MRVLVTGGAGFIGSHIVDALLERGADVAVVDNLSRGKREFVPRAVRFYEVDIRHPDLRDVLEHEKPEVVIHQAAQASVAAAVKKPAADAGINVVGTVNLLDACRLAGVRKIVYASSAAVYGNPKYLPVDEDHPVAPLSGYGISKYVPEMYLAVYRAGYGLDYTVLRYANVYGPRQDAQGEGGVVAIFTRRIRNGEAVVIFGDGEQTRDFVYVEDVVRANLAALHKGSGAILNVGTNIATSVNRLCAILKEVAGDFEISYTKPRPGDIRHSTLDNRRIRNVLGWKPQYSLRRGILETYRAVR
ncbi:MAG: NAD-dependent epimerase/dehydratase family protein [Peptococcaceae bacterium]|nr:NAD-dependent epimerase/dehydratase family protein [Peptococcaceae bacterium]